VASHAAADVVVHPAIVTSDALSTRAGRVSHPPTELSLQLSAMGRDVTLHLTPSNVTQFLDDTHIDRSSLPAFYRGTVAGDETSWARITIEAGQPTGHIYTYDQLLRLELTERIPATLAADTADIDTDWVVFEPSTARAGATLLPLLDHIQFAPPPSASRAHRQADHNETSIAQFNSANLSASQIDWHRRQSVDNTMSATDTAEIPRAVTRAMRVGIAIDSRFDEHHDGRGLARALSIMNGVDGIYQQQLGVAVIVDSVKLYDTAATDPMRDQGGSVESMLTAFRQVRLNESQLPTNLALVHLFSGHRDPQTVIGLGWIDTACRLDGYDVSMSTPFPFDTLLAAHEIAHNLGAFHDDDPACANQIDGQDSIMWSRLSGQTNQEFSRCSLLRMQPAIGAECNVDNIDLAVSMQATQTPQATQRIVAVRVTNKDSFRSASDVRSRTTFPANTQISNQTAGCRVEGNSLRCEHGTIAPGGHSAISALATLSDVDDQQVITELELNQFADYNDRDNRAALNVLQFDLADGNPNTIATSNTQPESGAASGSGSGGLLWLELLLLLSVVSFYRVLRDAD